jgi:uncharacterized membrane protein YtjA (UPF0391 family)
MLKWAAFFLVIALISGAFGFSGVAAAATGMAKILFYLFLVLCAGALILGIFFVKKL